MNNETTTYLLTDGPSGVTTDVQATDLEDAREQAREWAIEGYDASESTFWVDVEVSKTVILGDGDEAWESTGSIAVAIDPPAPECRARDEEHDWQSPHDLVGGIEDNPGVWANDGVGVRVVEACVRCGCKRVTNTGAQRPDNGQRGFTSVNYEEGAAFQGWLDAMLRKISEHLKEAA